MHGRAEKQTCKNNVCKLKFKKRKKEKDLLQLLQLQLRSIEHDLKNFGNPKSSFYIVMQLEYNI